MKASQHLIAASFFTLAGIAAGRPPEAPVAVNLEGVPQPWRARIEEKAKEGATALIAYLNRTRHLHDLRADQVVKPQENASALGKKDEVRTAESGKPERP